MVKRAEFQIEPKSRAARPSLSFRVGSDADKASLWEGNLAIAVSPKYVSTGDPRHVLIAVAIVASDVPLQTPRGALSGISAQLVCDENSPLSPYGRGGRYDIAGKRTYVASFRARVEE